jgi:hypothetical protein
MNDQAVEALRDAMEPPTWWTNRARLSPREILDRLEEHGYTVAPVNQIAEASSGTSAPVIEQPVSDTLWPEMAARAEQLAAWEARSDERLEAATFPVDIVPPVAPEIREVAAPVPPTAPEVREIAAAESAGVAASEVPKIAAAGSVEPAAAQPGDIAMAGPAEISTTESAPVESHRPGGLAGLMADLESRVAAVRHVHSEESTPADEDQQRSA